jgi:hypothetical protein
LLIPLVALLTGCPGKDPLDVSVKLDSATGLQANTSVLIGEQTVGTVTGVNPSPEGGYVATVIVKPEFRDQARADSRFILERDPADAARRRLLIQAGRPDAEPLRDGAVVQGLDATRGDAAMGEWLKGLSQGLGALGGIVERLRGGFQNLPQSAEASRAAAQFGEGLDKLGLQLEQLRRQLESKENTEELRHIREQWGKLQADLKHSQIVLEETIKKEVTPRLQKEVLPRLQEEMGALEKSFRKMEAETRPPR